MIQYSYARNFTQKCLKELGNIFTFVVAYTTFEYSKYTKCVCSSDFYPMFENNIMRVFKTGVTNRIKYIYNRLHSEFQILGPRETLSGASRQILTRVQQSQL